MKIKAEFIGQTSCGFVSNGIYKIKMVFKGNWIWIYDLHSAARCPYSNINKVAENWRMPISQDEQVGRFSMATMNKMVFPEARSEEEETKMKARVWLPDSNGIWEDVPRR